jgi:hypothetical protein
MTPATVLIVASGVIATPERLSVSIVCIATSPCWATSGIEFLDDGVGAREQQRGVFAVVPADEVWGTAGGATDLEDLAVAIGLSSPMPLDDDPVSCLGVHNDLLAPATTNTTPVCVVVAEALVHW